MFSFTMNLASVVGIVAGGHMYQKVGFDATMRQFSALIFMCTVLNGIFNAGCNPNEERKRELLKLERLAQCSPLFCKNGKRTVKS